jgi:hypothetical protein
LSKAKKCDESKSKCPATTTAPSYEPTPIAVLEGNTSHKELTRSKKNNLLKFHDDKEGKNDKTSKKNNNLSQEEADLHPRIKRESSTDGKL